MSNITGTVSDRVGKLIGHTFVDRSAYTDPEIFNLEMDRLFGRMWLYAGHECQIPETGDYFTTRLGRRDVIIVRAGNGAIKALVNRCTHRSAHVCGNARGRVQRFVCPYHSWNYGLDGRLLSVPMAEEYGPSFDREAHALAQIPRVDSYRGFIFARAAETGPDLKTFLGPTLQAFDDLVDRSPSGEIEPIEGVIRHRYRANWKMMFENLNDVYHPIFAHASAAAGIKAVSDPTKLHRIMRSLIAGPNMLPMMTKLTSNMTPYGHSFVSGLISIANPEIPRDGHFRALAAVHGEERALEILSTDLHLVLIYPSCNINPSQQTIRVVRPISVDETEVWGYCFRLKGVPDYVTRNSLYYCNYATSAFSPVVADDLEIYERAQENLTVTADARNDYARGLDATAPDVAASNEAYIRNQYQVWLEHLADEEAGNA